MNHYRSTFVFIIIAMLALITPVLAVAALPHTVIFKNSVDQPIWVNIQGGPKGVCPGVIDNGTHQVKKCGACSMCPG
jgi:hypothetical protein